MHTKVWWRNLKEGENKENLGLDGKVKLISIAEK
jgi:hypothetical protein